MRRHRPFLTRSCCAALWLAAFLVPWGLAAPGVAADDEGRPSACLNCHEQFDDELGAPVAAWSLDVHAAAGLGCEGCHGGDPSVELSEDPEASMARQAGFRGAPGRLGIPEFCGRCHADAEYMKQFNPQARVDQLAEYRTSVHGKRNAAGDPVPATCIDCHGVHGIRPVISAESPVFASNVPHTCARCHANAEMMSPYGISSNQFANYMRSAHAAALYEREDTAAPACNDCHGNHGAAPPGVKSVANVCGQCHGREAALFRASFKKELFDAEGWSECAVCHGNHRIIHPTQENFRTDSQPRVSRGVLTSMDPVVAELGDLAIGEKAELEWIIVLPPHVRAGDPRLRHVLWISAKDQAPIEMDVSLQPGMVKPSDLTRTASSDFLSVTVTMRPLSGRLIKAGDAVAYRAALEAGSKVSLRQVKVEDWPGEIIETHRGSFCLQCHERGDECDRATGRMYAALTAMDYEAREAEILLMRSERAGLDVHEAQFSLKSEGQNALIEARALIHAFDPDRLVTHSDEARQIAAAGIEAGQGGMSELRYRKRGLVVSLLLISLVLVGLALKIRELERARRTSSTVQA